MNKGIKKEACLRAFTLIELLVVIAITGILATIITWNVMSARKKANEAAAKQTASDINKAFKISETNSEPINFTSATEYPKFSDLLLSLEDGSGNKLYSSLPQWVLKAESENPNSFEVKEWPTMRISGASTTSLGIPDGTVIDYKERIIQINPDYELLCQEIIGVTYRPNELIKKTCLEHKIGSTKPL